MIFRNDWVSVEFVDGASGLQTDVCGGFVVVGAVTFFGPGAEAAHDIVGIVALVYEQAVGDAERHFGVVGPDAFGTTVIVVEVSDFVAHFFYI